MKAERWQQIDKLLERVLELEPGERRDFLDEACAGDEELFREVEALLEAHEQAGSLLSSPAFGIANQKSADSLQSLTGETLGHYQILSRLGEGGMGVVYKARDTHLDRSVAIKVLPPALVADPDRKRRFAQEANAASALNHPNIITIHDIASDGGTDFIVMEYVEGKTLGQLIPRRGLKLNEVLKYAIQIADALAKAHAAGIIHRDLKPGNIMVGDGGLVKVLDFGLAKLIERPQVGEAGPTGTPQPQTEEGMILGTASYMSPEQAAGKPIDARSDIFSFGLVLYEMVTGQRAFQGDSKMSTLAAILNQEPKSVREIARAVPHDLEKIIKRCLRKEPSRRSQSMADVKVALEELKEESDSGKLAAAPASQRGRRRSLLWGAALLALLGAVAAAVWFSRSHSGVPEEPLAAVPLTSYPGYEGEPSFSPDGNQVAFVWDGDKQDNRDIYVKLIGGGPPLPLTRHPTADFSPAWSPDGRWIAFLRELPGGKAAVFLIPALGGSERKLAEIHNEPYSGYSGLAWSPDGKWLVVPDKSAPTDPYALFLLSVESGEKCRLTSPSVQLFGDSAPALSPDGHTLVFIRRAVFFVSDLYLLALSDGFKALGEPKRLTSDNRDTSSPSWTPDGREIIFSSGSVSRPNLWRVAASGSGKPQRLASVGEGGSYPAISRLGHRLAYTRELADPNIWRVGVAGPQGKTTPPMSFISSTRDEAGPEFSPDGKRIAFASDRSGGYEIWLCNSDGSNPVKLTAFGGPLTVGQRWSPDGEHLVFFSDAEGQYEIYVISANGGKPQRLTSDPANDLVPSWSRDGKWIYFASNRSGEHQVWKMPAHGGAAVQVTRKGGSMPVESPDGRVLYYKKRGEDTLGLWKVPVKGGEESQVLESFSGGSEFAVVDEGIYFNPRPDSAGHYSIQFFSFASKKTRVVATLEKPVFHGFTVSPDGRWILYSQIDQQGKDLMLVENFH
jgi:Tol biopolymer transport system component/predicted Ser/Thr protein kinase